MNRQTIFTAILILVLIALGALWYFYLSGRSAGDAETGVIDTSAYERITNLKLDTALFGDPVFRELKREAIPPPATEAIGRSNPFLPF
jgi:hypothetical protein